VGGAGLGGKKLFGITVLTKNDEGKIVRVAIHHRPLNLALKFSAELAQRLRGKVDASLFHQVTDPVHHEVL
jgi:hypothetical protein